jgi:hypothetical protein
LQATLPCLLGHSVAVVARLIGATLAGTKLPENSSLVS